MRNASPLWLLPLLVAGCAGNTTPPPDDHFYRLRTPGVAQPLARPLLTGTLEVERFAASGLLGERALLHAPQEQPIELSRYHYHFWEEAPAGMIADRLALYLRQANAASQVVTPETRVEADYQLLGRLRRLEQLTGPQPRVILELELGVRRARDRHLLLQQAFVAEVAANGDGVSQAVTALQTALERIVADFL